MNKDLETILSFINHIGLRYILEDIEIKSFLPGLLIRNGILIIDVNRLKHVGDILHEVGHLACMPPEIRNTMTDDLEDSDLHKGGEMMAIAWSYAACIYLKINPELVFHEDGYKGGGREIIENFNQGHFFGVPLLAWCGMCKPNTLSVDGGFPNMLSWTCKARPN
jgi:hypothetical protein